MKVTLSEINNNPQETNKEGKEAGIQTNELEHKEEINIQPEQKEETRIQNNEGKLRMLWDISKCANIWIMGVPEEKEENQEMQNLFEKMIENFP